MADWKAELGMLPEHMRESVADWIERGEPHPELMGSGFRALLSGGLAEIVSLLDQENLANLYNWGKFLYCYAPVDCHGSYPKIVGWWKAHHP